MVCLRAYRWIRPLALFLAVLLAAMTYPMPALKAEESASPAAEGTTQADKQTWSAERIEKIAKALAGETFTDRERASRLLFEAPPSQIETLLKIRLRSTDPEVRKRLHDAAHHIFETHVLRQTAEWRIGRGFLGIRWSLNNQPPGVSVDQVIPDTAARKGGLVDGDLIVKVDDVTVDENTTHERMMDLWRSMAPGDPMKLRVIRGENAEEIELDLTVGETPAHLRRADEDEAKATRIWKGFLDGSIKVDPKLLGDHPREAKVRLPDRRERLEKRKAAEAEESEGTPAKPLQTWPVEMEAPDAP